MTGVFLLQPGMGSLSIANLFCGVGWKLNWNCLQKVRELIIIPVQENNSVSFFVSAQYLVGLGKWSAQSNVVEEKASVTAEQNRKQQEAVILVAVQSGLLETGVR